MAGWWSIEVFHGAGAGAMSLPEPGDEPVVQVTGMTPPGGPEPVQAGVL